MSVLECVQRISDLLKAEWWDKVPSRMAKFPSRQFDLKFWLWSLVVIFFLAGGRATSAG